MDTEEIYEKLEGKDVGQKRYLMSKIIDKLLEDKYPEITVEKRLDRLKQDEGYLYKLVQDFFLSSSTAEKERKLEKIREHTDLF